MFEHVGQAPGVTSRGRGLKRRMTRTEERLWKELRKLNLNFRRRAPIGRYFADFACHARRLVIEVDGGVHESLPDVAARDVERQRWLEGEGYRVLRFTDRQVSGDVHRCIEHVQEAFLLDGGGLGGGECFELSLFYCVPIVYGKQSIVQHTCHCIVFFRSKGKETF